MYIPQIHACSDSEFWLIEQVLVWSPFILIQTASYIRTNVGLRQYDLHLQFFPFENILSLIPEKGQCQLHSQ